MSFHHATTDSDRIRRIWAALRHSKEAGMTTAELNLACGSTRASSDVSEARANGIDIVCRYIGLTKSGRRLHKYWLKEFAPL